MRILKILLIAATVCQVWLTAQEPTVTFGTTVVSSSGFQGKIYHLKKDTDLLPRLDKMKSVGTIYTKEINIRPQEFHAGFPGITDRVEWFGILYTGKIWIEQEGRYSFSLLSDDGSALRVNGKMVIDNDGIHGPRKLDGSAVLTRGVHEIQVGYFQGPRFHLALELRITPPSGSSQILNTENFRAPAAEGRLEAGKIREIREGSSQSEVELPNRQVRRPGW